jgi:uncharacterized cupin superfamily protein
MTVPEARLEQGSYGLAPASEGWFCVNVREAAWVNSPELGAACIFEGGERRFADLGYTIAVLAPGQSGGRYHGERNQEDFLVLAGECLLLIEGQERRLRAWDFVHCPPWTEHGFVGAGDGPCVIFMAGGRFHPDETIYPRNELALRHGVGVERSTTRPKEAYAPYAPWEPGPPPSFDGLPWA